MNLLNATKMVAACTMGMAPDGREQLVAVAKGTFDIQPRGAELALAEDQGPLTATDDLWRIQGPPR